MTNKTENFALATGDSLDDLIDTATPEMLAAQQKMQSRVDQKGVSYQWKDGQNKLRLLPAKKGVGQAYFAVRQHWVDWPGEDGKPRARPFLCLAPTGSVCPLCELAAQVKMSDEESGKRMESRPSFIYNVLDMADPDAGPKVCFFSWEAHKGINELWENGEDPTDYVSGPVFSVKREKRGRVTYTTTPLSSRYQPPIEALRGLHDLRKYATIPSPEQLEHAVGVLTGAVPSGASFQPSMQAARPAIGSRASGQSAQQQSVAPPRRNITSILKDE